MSTDETVQNDEPSSIDAGASDSVTAHMETPLSPVLNELPKQDHAGNIVRATTDLHRAVLIGDIDLLRVILAAHPEWVHCHDATHGNTPCHLAADLSRLDMVQVLFDCGARSRKRNNARQTVLKVAACRAAIVWAEHGINPKDKSFAAYHPGLDDGRNAAVLEAEKVLLRCASQLDKEFAQSWLDKRGPFCQALASLPDFRMAFHWRFSSWIPLLGTIAPSDTYTVTKIGSTMRVDFSLVNPNPLKQKRGCYSILFEGEESSSKTSRALLLIDWDLGIYANVSPEANLKSFDPAVTEIASILRSHVKGAAGRHDVSVTYDDLQYTPLTQPAESRSSRLVGWFTGRSSASPVPRTKEVAGWTTIGYEISGIDIRVRRSKNVLGNSKHKTHGNESFASHASASAIGEAFTAVDPAFRSTGLTHEAEERLASAPVITTGSGWGKLSEFQRGVSAKVYVAPPAGHVSIPAEQEDYPLSVAALIAALEPLAARYPAFRAFQAAVTGGDRDTDGGSPTLCNENTHSKGVFPPGFPLRLEIPLPARLGISAILEIVASHVVEKGRSLPDGAGYAPGCDAPVNRPLKIPDYLKEVPQMEFFNTVKGSDTTIEISSDDKDAAIDAAFAADNDAVVAGEALPEPEE